MFKLIRDRSGFVLIHAIVASALGLLGIFLMNSALNRMGERNRNIELSGELQTIRLVIKNNLECRDTLNYDGENKVACDGSPFVLKNKFGKELFVTDSAGAIRGSSGYQLRGRCLDAAEGMIIEYKRGNAERTFKDPLTKREQDWYNLFDPKGVWMKDWSSLFNRSERGFFCQEAFGTGSSDVDCTDDQIMVGIGENGEPQCEKVWSRLSFKACIQLSDASCNAQNGPVSCTECSGEFAQRPHDLLKSPNWAFDATTTNLDCARVFLQRCDGLNSDPFPVSDSINPFQPQRRGLLVPPIAQRSSMTTGDCSGQCNSNEVMVGYNRYTERYCSNPCLMGCCGWSLRHECNWACQTTDEDRNVSGFASVGSNGSGVNCPPPVATGIINKKGDTCGSGCIDTLMAARDVLMEIAAQRYPDPDAVPPFIRDLSDRNKVKKRAGNKVFVQIKKAAAALQCDPLKGAKYRK